MKINSKQFSIRGKKNFRGSKDQLACSVIKEGSVINSFVLIINKICGCVRFSWHELSFYLQCTYLKTNVTFSKLFEGIGSNLAWNNLFLCIIFTC